VARRARPLRVPRSAMTKDSYRRCIHCGSVIRKAKPFESLLACECCGTERYQPAHKKCDERWEREARAMERVHA
jgi:predicted  nucleic acid-binding Zn-ribbon protein